LAKLRLLLKTKARIWVFAADPAPAVLDLAATGKITLIKRALAAGHVIADQYAMAQRAGFDEVEISPDLARRQPQEAWVFRADWRAHDYQNRLRGE
jgi:siroheme synthase (precorrin-2 oxidase/ferrochelatase)